MFQRLHYYSFAVNEIPLYAKEHAYSIGMLGMWQRKKACNTDFKMKTSFFNALISVFSEGFWFCGSRSNIADINIEGK